MGALDGLFGLRRLFVDGIEQKFQQAIEFVSAGGSGPLASSERIEYGADGKPFTIRSITLPAGEQGEPGPPGEGVDPTLGEPGFTAGPTGVLLETLTLETGKHYQVAYHGLNYNGTLASGLRSRPFDISVCVSTLTGAAVLQSPTVGTPQPTSGSGQIEFAVSGLAVQVWLYGASADTEWFGDLVKVTEYDPAVQIPDGWTPASESSCIAAFQAGVATTVNGSNNVTAWGGQKGTVTATPSGTVPYVASRASLGNKPACYLAHTAGGEKFNVANLTYAASDYSIFFVGDQETPLDDDGYVFDCQTGRLCCATDRNGTAIQFNDGTFKGVGAAAVTGAQYVSWILDGSAVNLAQIWKNGTKISTAGSLDYTRRAIGGAVRLGSQYNGTTGGLWKGWYAGLWVFDSVDPVIRFRMHKWIQQEYSL